MRHHIQKQILDVLSRGKAMRYADINPTKLEGNVFTYHLKQLIIDKLIVQNDDKTYSLSAAGRSFIVHRYEDQATAAHTIFLVVIRSGDKLLLRKRLVQPMLRYTGFIHGEPQADMSVEDSVRARVLSKTGLNVETVSIHGSGLIRMTVDGAINNFSHTILVSATISSGDLIIKEDATGENYWVHANDMTSVEKLLPSCKDALKYIEQDSRGWFDFSYEL